jgi:hypothetical protein
MQLLKDKGIKYITYGWIGFISENVIISHNREYIISHLGGESTYRNLYSLFSSLATLSICYGYFRYARNCGPLRWTKINNKKKGFAFLF